MGGSLQCVAQFGLMEGALENIYDNYRDSNYNGILDHEENFEYSFIILDKEYPQVYTKKLHLTNEEDAIINRNPDFDGDGILDAEELDPLKIWGGNNEGIKGLGLLSCPGEDGYCYKSDGQTIKKYSDYWDTKYDDPTEIDAFIEYAKIHFWNGEIYPLDPHEWDTDGDMISDLDEIKDGDILPGKPGYGSNGLITDPLNPADK